MKLTNKLTRFRHFPASAIFVGVDHDPEVSIRVSLLANLITIAVILSSAYIVALTHSNFNEIDQQTHSFSALTFQRPSPLLLSARDHDMTRKYCCFLANISSLLVNFIKIAVN